MSKTAAIFLICFTVLIFNFVTWQLFAGNFEAAFSALPFLIIIYLFLAPWKKRTPEE